MNARRKASLAAHLETTVKDLESRISWESPRFSVQLGESDPQEYFVLTDKEATAQAKETILETLWAFNKSFLAKHMQHLTSRNNPFARDAYELLNTLQLDKLCEGANSTILRLLDDVPAFVRDAISEDGRGHFISRYDSEEHKQGRFFIYRMN